MNFNTVTIIPQDQLIIVDESGLYVNFKYPDNVLKIQYTYRDPDVVYYYNDDSTITTGPKEDLVYYIHIWETEKTRLDSTYKIDKQSQERLIEYYSNIIQKALNTFAKTRRYDDIFTACSYFNSTDPIFAKEGQYCIELRDKTWRKGYQILDEVLAGIRDIPTEEELVELLPVFEATWPD